ncbi:hypothetical protein [Pedobacter antarcticus]|uniref:hypothetical protein n=1 Tax=Pedobacter antarcticus TaxID=34086 RepID=UPI001C57EB65|nr:hypothetical protein [Pedobacter antarcticus]
MKTTKKYFGLLAIVLLMSTSLNASTGKRVAPAKNCIQYAYDMGAQMFNGGGFTPREIFNMTLIHYQVCSGQL